MKTNGVNIKNLQVLEHDLHHVFRDKTILKQALAHSSYINEHPDEDISHNERLEFFGDAILGFVITGRLFHLHPSATEGELTLMKSVLVSEPTLAHIADSLHLGEYLLLGKGEEANGGRKRPSILSNALEAVIGAVYLDSSIKETTNVIKLLFEHEFGRVESKKHSFNYKNLLQQHSQTENGDIPEYLILNSHGPDHKKQFEVAVKLHGKTASTGRGRSKKEAEENAAYDALKALGLLDE
jgi:ribonuclease-3